VEKSSPIVLLIIATSFGEVDWILPALVSFKEKYPDWEIISIFGHEIIYYKLKQNSELFTEFNKISRINLVVHEFDKLFESGITTDQIKIILKDFNPDNGSPFKSIITAKCPQALVVSYPHSNYIYGNSAKDKMQKVPNPDAYSKHDHFLLCSEHDIPFWSSRVDIRKVKALGFPCFDSWWMTKLIDSSTFIQSKESIISHQFSKKFFFVSRGPHPIYLDLADYEYLVQSLTETVFSYEDSFLFIKLHPREDVDLFTKILLPYDSSRWMISGLHLNQLAYLSDVVISFWSSGILNSLAVNKPVIEYYRYGDKNPDWRLTSDGKRGSTYSELGLSVPAGTKEELAVLLESALHDPKAGLWHRQAEAFQRHCKFTDNAAGAIADLLFKEATGVKTAVAPGKVSPGQSAVIDAMIDYVGALVDKDDLNRARQWFDFLVAQFPGEPEVFTNRGIFLFNQGDFAGAVDSLTHSLTLVPHYRAGAVNLVHMLLALERLDEALDVVVSFYTQAPDGNTRREFLQALRNELDDALFTQIQTQLARNSSLAVSGADDIRV
jgi:tetratricopeptide (TPR) repeat protein